MSSTPVVLPQGEDHSGSLNQLETTRRRVSLALEASRMALWQADLAAETITWTTQVYELLGCEDFRGTFDDFSRWVHPEDREAVANAIERAYYDEAVFSYEFRWWHGVKGWRWLVCHALGEPNAAGRSAKIFGTVQDITEAHEAATRLSTSELRFRQIAETIDEVFWLSDVDKTEIVYISPGYEKVWGRTTDSLYDDPLQWLFAIHPEDRERVSERMRLQALGQYDEEYRILRPDGEVRWIHDRAFPVTAAAGEVVRIAGVAEDVTRRRELEAQLRHTQKMQSIGELAGGVAHDFNNLLTVISTAAQLLDTALGEDPLARDLLGEIRAAQERASALTRQLLAFSRREISDPRVVEVDSVVADTEKMLRRIVGEDIAVVTRLGATGANVRIDPGQLVQVLMNLVVNARDAMPRGGELTISTSLQAFAPAEKCGRETGPGVLLTVEDSGTGMSDEVRARVFEPFFTTKDIGQGTGMGLSVVHGIVAQNGGSIEVRSRPGEGSAFRIFLPSVTAPAEDVAGERSGSSAGRETILVVEDEASVRRMVEKALKRHGYVVITAASGIEAAQLIGGGFRPDLLLTDVVMPGMDGRQLSEEVHEYLPDLKVLFTSGYTDDTLLKRGIHQSEVAFLAKPYTLETLANRISEVLRG